MGATCSLTRGWISLVPRPSITANVVEGPVKLLHRMTSAGCTEGWHFHWTAVLVHARCDTPCLRMSTWHHSTNVGVYQALHCISCDWRPGNKAKVEWVRYKSMCVQMKRWRLTCQSSSQRWLTKDLWIGPLTFCEYSTWALHMHKYALLCCCM